MLTLAAPGFLLAAAVGAALVGALHLLAWRRPRPAPLPTARFVPPQALRAASRELRLQDVALMAVRMAALLLAGLALAAPRWRGGREGVGRVIVADASRAVERWDELRDSVRAAAGGASRVVIVRVDSVARVLRDSLEGRRAEGRGVLAAGMVAAVREAHRLRSTSDTVEVVVVAAFARESWDSAMTLVRREWPGAVRTIRVSADPMVMVGAAGGRTGVASAGRPAHQLPGTASPVGAALTIALGNAPLPVRFVPGPLAAADSTWALGGGVVVQWDTTEASEGERVGPAVLLAEHRAAVAQLSPTARALPPGRTVLRWGDGSSAATERGLGRGCIRSVGVRLSPVGDAPLRPALGRVLAALGERCGGGAPGVLDDGELSAWGAPLAPVASVADGRARAAELPEGGPADASGAISRALLLAVGALLLLEWWMRRRASRDGVVMDEAAAPPAREAA